MSKVYYCEWCGMRLEENLEEVFNMDEDKFEFTTVWKCKRCGRIFHQFNSYVKGDKLCHKKFI